MDTLMKLSTETALESRTTGKLVSSRVTGLVNIASVRRIRVDGLQLVDALLTDKKVKKLEKTVFSDAALDALDDETKRIEFIYEGKLPMGLREESELKQEVIFTQTIDYDICKSCRLCIEVCPNDVYLDDGFGRPDRDIRRSEECTGRFQCGKCMDICPEKTLKILQPSVEFNSTLFVLLDDSAIKDKQTTPKADFYLPNPLEKTDLSIPKVLDIKNLSECHAVLEAASFLLVLETNGYLRDMLSTTQPETELQAWAEENGRDFSLVNAALVIVYKQLSHLTGLQQGKYQLGEILHRVIDEVIHTGIKVDTSGGRELLTEIVDSAYVEEAYLGAKRRPIGGLLPTGTSTAWKTPYGEEVPKYEHLEKCLGPECGLCVTHCPEGSGGINSAIRMDAQVPLGTMPAIVRGFDAFLIRFDMEKNKASESEDLRGKAPFTFNVDPDYCKSCGICWSCCPHDVIEPVTRAFDLRQSA